MAKSHKDVEFTVLSDKKDRVFKTFDEAAAFAVGVALSGRPAFIDVVVLSSAGARWLAGDDGAAQWKEDPEASVFSRIEIEAHDRGRIP